MNSFKILCSVFIFVALFNSSLFSQQNKDSSIAVLPFVYKGIDPNTITSAQTILKSEILKLSNYKLIPDQQITEALQNTSCDEIVCALKIGKAVNADKVALINFLTLGQKTIVHYSFYNVNKSEKIVIDDITSNNLEELDAVMKRIAVSIIKNETVKQSAEIGNIVPNESKTISLRGARRIGTLSFGYLFPREGYSGLERSFTVDYKISGDLENINYGVQLFARDGVGVNIFTSYLFTKSDICPYAGFGLGFHWIQHETNIINSLSQTSEKKKGDGFELNINTGFILFRTYSLSLVVNFSYAMTFNDFNSRASVLTIGVIY